MKEKSTRKSIVLSIIGLYCTLHLGTVFAVSPPEIRLSTSESTLPGLSSVDYRDNVDGYPYIDYVPVDASRFLNNADILSRYLNAEDY